MPAPCVRLQLIGEDGEPVTGHEAEWEFGHITDGVKFFEDSDRTLDALFDGNLEAPAPGELEDEDEDDEDDEDEDDILIA